MDKEGGHNLDNPGHDNPIFLRELGTTPGTDKLNTFRWKCQNPLIDEEFF
jgi:hypothetical protein